MVFSSSALRTLTLALLVLGFVAVVSLGCLAMAAASLNHLPAPLADAWATLKGLLPQSSHPVTLLTESVTSGELPIQQPTWQSVLITFVTVFVAEMGDKTQLATMLMSAQAQSPWAIFWGSASALVTASFLSVVLGGGLSQVLPPTVLQLLASIGFIVIGSYVLWQALREQPTAATVAEGEMPGLDVQEE